MNRKWLIGLIDHYLRRGFAITTLTGGAGDDWREIRVVFTRKPRKRLLTRLLRKD